MSLSLLRGATASPPGCRLSAVVLQVAPSARFRHRRRLELADQIAGPFPGPGRRPSRPLGLAAKGARGSRLGPTGGRENRLTLAGLLLFALLFGLQVTLSAKKGDRYLLPVHPPLTLIAAMGWSMLAYWLAERWPAARRLVPTLVLGAVLALQAATSAQVFPYYLSYYNPLLGGPQAAMEVLTVGWGEGLDQAAIYLNQKPDAAHLRVAAWYMPSFSYFFKGRSMPIDSAIDISRERLRRLWQADYLVI